ncbi:MAG TPA: TMEM175 family protein [Streptosporangiaceae bacterium]
MSDDERGFESRGTDRLVAFSDAVVAIAITLLALDLPVPTGATMSKFLSSVGNNTDHYVAFLISFVVIAAAWRRYHGVFRYIQRVDARVRNLNVLWLLTIILNPFATRLLTTPGPSSAGPRALQFGFYALLQVLSSAALLLMVHHVAARGLQAPDTPPLTETQNDWESYGVMLGFGLSIPLFFVTSYAWVIWIVVPLLVGQVADRRRRRDGHARGPKAT